MAKHTNFFDETRAFSQTRLSNPIIRYAAIFLIGLAIGWFMLGWVIFPVKYTNAYPNELEPEVVNDYLLMTAESYGATHDLRAAAKRLKYWEPEDLAAMFTDLALSIETTNPAGAAYLRILAKDLHLSSAPESSTPPASSHDFTLIWFLLFLIIALVLLAALIKIAQRFGVLGAPSQPQPDRMTPTTPTAAPSPAESGDLAPHPTRPSAPLAIPAVAEVASDQPGNDETAPAEDVTADDFAPDDVSDQEPLFSPETAPPVPPETGFDDFFDDDLEAPPHEEPAPAPPASENTMVEEETASPFTTRIFRFDGTPAYNTIAAIEENDEYLGEYGLSAGQTAPDNPNLTLTLEVWLFDKSDTQTVEAVFVPTVIAGDPALQARYAKERAQLFPLQTGQIILLETAELRLEGRVRRVTFGPVTNDGVPVVNYAEIEMLGRRK